MSCFGDFCKKNKNREQEPPTVEYAIKILENEESILIKRKEHVQKQLQNDEKKNAKNLEQIEGTLRTVKCQIDNLKQTIKIRASLRSLGEAKALESITEEFVKENQISSAIRSSMDFLKEEIDEEALNEELEEILKQSKVTEAVIHRANDSDGTSLDL